MSCANCHLAPPTVPHLKLCAKCTTTKYCSRTCQKQHFKQHKKECVANAAQQTSRGGGSSDTPTTNAQTTQATNSRPGTGNFDDNGAFYTTSRVPMAANLTVHFEDPFTRIRNGRFLHGRVEVDVFKVVIDTWRLRMDDRYRLERVAESDGCYYGIDGMEGGLGNDGIAGFRWFLERVVEGEGNRGVLPGWWDGGRREGCVTYTLTSQSHSLTTPLTRKDIEAYYNSPSLLYLQLRTFGAWLYNGDVGTTDSKKVLQFMVAKERDGEWPSQEEIDRIFGRE